jgi:RNA polymerase sigma-70 factor (ECF subfamily)
VAAPPVQTVRSGFSDSDLIARVLRADDRNAFAELVRRHQSALRASLRKMTGNAELADDIAQETFILAWKKIGSFRFEAKFSTWLYRIAFNAWQSGARRTREVQMDAAFQSDDSEAAQPPESDATERRRDLQRAMAVLNEAERSAIFQCYYNDLSHDEAAYVLGIPLGTLKTNVLRAKEKMRARLMDYTPNDIRGVAA